MRKAKKEKGEKPKELIENIYEEMFLRKAENKAVKLLEDLKNTEDHLTRPVHAKDYGFNNSLVMLVDPNLSDEDIIRKFYKRLNVEFSNFDKKRNMHV